MFKSYLLLAACALFPVIFAAGFFLLEKHTKFKNLKFWPKQIIIGLVFGFLAILGTHCGIPFSGALANVRDGAVVIAGLGFGWPAGVIAGLFAGIERFVAVYFPNIATGLKYFTFKVGSFTQWACAISTILAGVFAGLMRKFIFNDKRPGAISAFFIGFVIETFHILMVFVLRASEYQQGYLVVKGCSYPMILMNSIAAGLGIFVLNLLEKGKSAVAKPNFKSLNSIFIVTLAGLTIFAFGLSETFVVTFQSRMASRQVDSTLEQSIDDISADVTDWVNDEITLKCDEARELWGNLADNVEYTTNEYEGMNKYAEALGITEVNVAVTITKPLVDDGHPVLDDDGNQIMVQSAEIKWTNVDTTQEIFSSYHGFDMGEYEQSAPFTNLVQENGDEYLIQEFRIMALSDEAGKPTYRKYAGVRTEFGLIQIGYDEKALNDLISFQITDVSANKHVGETGSVLVLDSEFQSVSKAKHAKFDEADPNLIKILDANNQGKTFNVKLGDAKYKIRFYYANSYYIISLYPTEEANLIRNIDIYINTFLEIIVFGLIFLTTYVLVTELVIKRIQATNESLEKITKGDLKEVVKGGNTTEFQELANGINSTVTALEGYIDAANKRIDEELAFAKAIQTSVLPSTFPAFPDRKEFDIHASMHTAKEVGGDFYDFYFSNQHQFHFAIADVSGKGIPAALFMMRAKQALKSLTQTNIPVNEVFERGNSNLCEGNEAGMFVTAWEASVDLDTDMLSYANGGHNPPLIKHPNGKFEYLKSIPNMVLAGMDGLPYKYNEFKLEIGDIIYLYTDGVTEAVNEKTEQFGEQRLQDILNSREFANCQEICDFVYDEVNKFKGEADQFDDITMVAFKYNGKVK